MNRGDLPHQWGLKCAHLSPGSRCCYSGLAPTSSSSRGSPSAEAPRPLSSSPPQPPTQHRRSARSLCRFPSTSCAYPSNRGSSPSWRRPTTASRSPARPAPSAGGSPRARSGSSPPLRRSWPLSNPSQPGCARPLRTFCSFANRVRSSLVAGSRPSFRGKYLLFAELPPEVRSASSSFRSTTFGLVSQLAK